MSHRLLGIARFGGLGLAVLLALAPFYWMLLVSLSAGADQVTLGDPWWLRKPAYVGNYLDLLTSPAFGRWMLNTVEATGFTIVVGVAASLAAGYAAASLRPRPAQALVTVLLATYAFPQIVLALPMLVLMSRLGLEDTTAALMLAYPGLVIPFGTWAFWNLLSDPDVRELLEQARLEGARGGRLVLQVILPVARPAVAVVAIFAVAVVFNDYLYLFVLVTGDQATTVMGAVQSTNPDVENPGFDFAAMLLGAAPAALVCAWFTERYAGRFLSGAAGE